MEQVEKQKIIREFLCYTMWAIVKLIVAQREEFVKCSKNGSQKLLALCYLK